MFQCIFASIPISHSSWLFYHHRLLDAPLKYQPSSEFIDSLLFSVLSLLSNFIHHCALQSLKVHVLPWYPWTSQGPHGLAMIYPAFARYAPYQVGKIPQPDSPYICQTSCIPSGPNRNYSNRLMTFSHMNERIIHILVTTKPTSPSSFWFTLLLTATLVWSCIMCRVLLPWVVSICD